MKTKKKKQQPPTEVIERWQRIKTKLDKLRTKERTLRDTVVATCFDTDGEGTRRMPLSEDSTLVYAQSLRYTLDADKLTPRLLDQLPDGLIRWKPQLDVRAYKELSARQRKLIDEALTVSLAAPSLRLEEPRDD